MGTKENKTYQQLELERINTQMSLQRLEKGDKDDPVNVQSRLQLTIKLQRVEAALARHKSEDYGICLTCKNKINVERLAALPYAEYCLGCQRQQEKKRVGYRKQYTVSYQSYQ